MLSIGTVEEHGFIMHQLNMIDPQHRRWYTGVHQQSPNYWINPDGSQLVNMDNAFLPDPDPYGKDYLAYKFSLEQMRWGLEVVRGNEPLLFICEANIVTLQRLVTDDRTYEYGIEIDNPERVPRGPYFIKEPKDFTFDTSERRRVNYATLSCLAGGYPTPTYQWFKESYENDRLVPREIDPLSDLRYTVSGGTLIINNPQQVSTFSNNHHFSSIFSST